jgi:hypothetical protein
MNKDINADTPKQRTRTRQFHVPRCLRRPESKCC